MKTELVLSAALMMTSFACGAEQNLESTGQGARDRDRDASDDKPPSEPMRRDAGMSAPRDRPPPPPPGEEDEDDADEQPGGPVEDVCDSVTIQARPNSPEVLIVLDRSGSMVGFGDARNQGRNRWEPSVNALKGLTGQLDEVVSFGLMLFPAPGSGGGGRGGVGNLCTPGMLSVPVKLGNGDAIGMSLDQGRPDNGATPTAATLENAHGVLTENFCADCVDAPKFVLLVTDGQPNCGDSGTQTTDADVNASLAAIDKLREAEIKTYVIGYDIASDEASAQIMEQFAQHGGTEKYIPVENEEDLTRELTRITASLVACDFELNEDIDNPALVRVSIDGEVLTLGQGWTVEGRTVVLQEACDRIRDAKVHNIKITKECEPRVFQ